METAVQSPASYSKRDPCLEQPGPSGCAKKIPKRPPLDNSAAASGSADSNNNNNNSNNDHSNNNGNSNIHNSANNNNRNKRRGSFGNVHDKLKRRRRNDMVLPTKFMLGGNITDPLNLKSLENEEINRLANQTPVASPAPAAGGGSERVEVIIPQNINDPLNLNGPEPVRAPSPVLKKNRRRRNRNQRRRMQDELPNVDTTTSRKFGGSNNSNNGNHGIKNKHSGGSNNINNNNSSNNNNNNSGGKKNNQNTPRFRFGNYDRYYGYRNGCDNDSRLTLLKKKWFCEKSCLDIGCNVGHVTLSIARDHQPKQMIGLDIDPDLIRIAKKNIRHYVHQRDTSGRWFPASCPLTFGPIAISGAQTGFPHNIFFIAGNYVLDNDELLETQKEEFDTIMCLSTTKWMQLNFGDSGLKRVFHRIFRQLKPGGRFILEPQPISSYHKFVTPELRENYRRMQLMPDMYPNFIINEVGFASYKVLGVASHGVKGFQRPLYLFRKAKEVKEQPEQQEKEEANQHAQPQQADEHQHEEEEGDEGEVGGQGEEGGDGSKEAQANDASKPPGPSPAHECDTTTASI